MRNPFTTTRIPIGCLALCAGLCAQPVAPAPAVPAATVDDRTSTLENSLVLKNAVLKTDWPAVVRNPFKYEVAMPTQDPVKAATEQIRVLGLGAMPDGQGGMRNYVFLEKESDVVDEAPASDKPVTRINSITLQAFPEILQDQTSATEEDSDRSSVSVGIERYWLIGISDKNAVFWIENTPITEDSLKYVALEEDVKVAIRKTERGTRVKLASEDDRGTVRIRRPKGRDDARKPDGASLPAGPLASKPLNGAPPKKNGIPDPLGPLLYGNPNTELDTIRKIPGK